MDEFVSKPRINWETWIREIRDIGKSNGLTNFAFNPYGQIDLDRAHPSGIAQFTSSGTALLSNLVREPLAFAKALTTARRIKAKSNSQRTNFGIETTYLVGGMASLEQAGFDLNLPLLLWPVSLVRKTDDFELTRTGSAFVNPALESALFDTYGIILDRAKLLSMLDTASDLLPIAVIEYISSLLSEKDPVEFRRGLVIGNFAIEPSLMEADINPEGNRLIRQLAEVSEVPEIGEEYLTEPRLVADADATQKRIVARAMHGDSFAVETLPGSGYTQTVLNVLAALVHDGKKVLVVTPRRQTINELSERLAQLQLGGLLVRSSSVWLDVVGAISRYEKATPVDLVEAGVQLEAASSNLETYLETFKQRNERIGYSLLEILESLAKLAAMPNPPTTTARLSLAGLERYQDRTEAITLLEAAQQSGLFKHGPADSAWFGANFDSDEQAQEFVSLAKHMHEVAYPALEKMLDDLVVAANFRRAKSLTEFGEYLTLCAGIAASLDLFVPEVFDRDVTELVEATGPRHLGGKISGSTRRRLKKLAKEYLRAGMSVNDLNQSLKDIKDQRDKWTEYSNIPSTPQIIAGFGDAQSAFRNFMSDAVRLVQYLDTDLREKLFNISVPDFVSRLASLANDLGPLENLDSRNATRAALSAAGLESVYRDFSRLHVDQDHLAAQFDQVWWQSAFEELLEHDPAVAAYSTTQINALEQDFIEADQHHNSLGVGVLNAMQAHQWKEKLDANPVESDSIRELLRTKSASFKSLVSAAPSLSNLLLGSFAASPFEVANLVSAGFTFDAVLLLDAAGTNVGENISALQRADQLIAFGDSAIAAPIGFEMEANEVTTSLNAESESVFDKVARIFGVESMRKSWRPTGQTLGTLINREFYQNRIIFEPTASDYSAKSNVDVLTVKAAEVSSSDFQNESPDAEVVNTVQEVIRHARKHPEGSLMVVAASDVHAERISSDLASKVLENADLKQFFDSHGDEKFEVTTLQKLSHRVADRVIFSPGFGPLASGKASDNLGQLSEPNSRRTFANLLVSARKSLLLVTSLSQDSLPEEPVGAAKQFAKMFSYFGVQKPSEEAIDVDPMLNDLALRLRKLGAHVTLGFTPRISMAVSYGAASAVIIPDWDLVGDDLSEKIRLRPALLESMGWLPIRVHALEVFADPQTLALRIGDQLGMRVSVKEQVLFDDPSFEETDAGWGESGQNNDQRLLGDKPPHWG